MTTDAIRISHDHTSEATLFVACELSEKTWKLGFTTAYGEKPRERAVLVERRIANRVTGARACTDIGDNGSQRQRKSQA